MQGWCVFVEVGLIGKGKGREKGKLGGGQGDGEQAVRA